MSERNDIIDGSEAAGRKYGLIYTRQCGWVDLGHANPASAKKLLRKLSLNNNGVGNKPRKIIYSQMMGNKYVKLGVRKSYIIKQSLTPTEKKSVALSIFFDVSNDFERFQGNWLFRYFTNSSYSAEDLVSNLIGFYRAASPGRNYIQLCEPVSKDIALDIWDKFGSVGENKNRTFGPYLYPVNPNSKNGPMSVVTPWFLRTIKRSQKGFLFIDE